MNTPRFSSAPVLWTDAPAPLAPTNRKEMEARGWDAVDVVFVTGDAYVDHPSFAMAILRPRAGGGRLPRRASSASPTGSRASRGGSSAGRGCSSRVSAGNMDSMINHYTANKKVRNDDAYSPGGRIGLRPDRATLPYCHRAREAFPGVPVIAGGVEASLRRLAHYDYWSDTVRRSILLDCKADLVVYGMGETAIVEIARRLAAGKTVQGPARPARRRVCPGREARSAALAAKPTSDRADADSAIARRHAASTSFCPPSRRSKPTSSPSSRRRGSSTSTPTRSTPRRWCSSTTARPSSSTRRRCRCREAEMDRVYDLPYTRRPHPSYTRADPRVRDDQGLGDDHARLLRRLHVLLDHRAPGPHHPVALAGVGAAAKSSKMAADPEFKGVVSDIGGPTANMYQMRCTRPEVEAKCKRLSCVHPTICKLLGTDHGPLIELMKRGPHRAGHPQGAGRQRHPHGPGPAVAGVHAGAGRPPRRRPPEGRPGAHRPARARA